MSTRQSGPAEPPVEPLSEPLTRREREILGLLADGHSAPEIAERLTLALSSVKWHIQHLYGKLGVNSKRQALNRAKELGLLGGVQSGSDLATQSLDDAQARPRHNLPLQVSTFFGRESEIAQLRKRISEHRLVTLVGSGGVGKSRLSLQVAEDLVGDFADGVWFTALAPLADPALVPQTIAAALSVRDEPGQSIVDALIRNLRPRQVLLVVDNCEHLLEASAQLAHDLLRTCPQLKILASSREPLGVEGEAVIAVPSLPFPAAGLSPSADELAGYAAVRLFTDRVHLTQPDYAVTPKNAEAVARICQRLDGIPLALELAAARLRLLDTETLAARLEDAFAVLTGGSRTALPRQQTLRATLDWSHRLLNDEERLLLQRLAVFAGGATLEAVEAVCSGDGLEGGQVLDRLSALVDKSMVNTERKPDLDTRYFLLETVRQYAREKLNEAGDGPRLRSRHRDFFLSFAETASPKLQTREMPHWRPRLIAERDNFRQALIWSFSDLSDVEGGLRLFLNAEINLWASHQEDLDWCKRAIALCESHPDIAPQLQVKVLQRSSWPVRVNEPQLGLTLLERSVAISRALGPAGQETLMWSLFHLGQSLVTERERTEEGLLLLAEAESILQALGPGYYPPEEGLRVKAWFAMERNWVALSQCNYLEVVQAADECIRLYAASGSPWFGSRARHHAGIASIQLGKYEQAREHFLAAEILFREQSGETGPYILTWLAIVDFMQGNLQEASDFQRAIDACRENLRYAPDPPDPNWTAINLGLLASVRVKQGHVLQAARLAGASASSRVRKYFIWEDFSPDTVLPGWRDHPDAAALQAAFDAGQAMSSDEAVAYALNND